MHLYVFQYSGYGEYYFVMSTDAESALQALKDYLKDKADKFAASKDSIWYVAGYQETWEMWKDASVDQLPNNYTLEIFEANDVQEDEHC